MSVNPNRPEQNCCEKSEHKPDESGFSPMLSALFTMILKDGFCNSSAFAMLRDVAPYVSHADAKIIDGLLKFGNKANHLMLNDGCDLHRHKYNISLSNRQKFLQLLQVLRRYGGKSSDDAFTMIERVMEMNDRVDGTDFNSMLELIMPGQKFSYKGKEVKNERKEQKNEMESVMQLLSMMNGGNASEMSSAMNMFNSMRNMGNMGNMGDMGNLAQLFSMMNKK